ncbi:vWA domain-containing protein [Microtetraspora niveoalba]|uniref:vWA domain-containing protein n=1 Tax=Microtetraspora niveoalba TaxID=46175 RepID=UPI00083120FA|nr:von Willebrand factor type A domain-containing protein [Microtetraspora niveoalba]
MKPRLSVLAGIALLSVVLAACGGGGTPSSAGRAAPGDQAAPAARPERDATAEQISTFALDVDTASYGYARRTIREGRLPEPTQVRIEEFVNSFGQDYAEPDDNGFAVHMDGARTDGAVLLRVGLRTRGVGAEQRRPANLTFVVDVSGSMAETGRLDLVRDALHTLVDQLMPGDQVSIVSFSDTARLISPMAPVEERARLHGAIDELRTEGSTNLEDGLVTGYQEASRAFRSVAVNRVILLSDGLANTGETQWRAILDRVGDYAAKQVTLLCVGVGREYGDELMEQLADNGDGAAVYVSGQEEARKVFVERLPANLDLRARDAKAQVVFNPATVESYSLLGYENRELTPEEFRDDSRDGGEVGPGHSVTALYWVRLRAGASGQLATATVRWLDPDSRRPAEVSRSVETGDVRGDLWTKAPLRLQVDAAAAAFAEYLRSPWTERGERFGLGVTDLAAHAARLAEATEDPDVAELADLIRRVRSLG